MMTRMVKCSLCVSASCGGGGEKDQEPGGAAGRDPDEETRDQAATLRGARDYYGPRERGSKWLLNHSHLEHAHALTHR